MRRNSVGATRKKNSFGPNGYTLIEIMIFLVVSSIIFLSAVILVSGQQEKSQFNQAMRDLNSRLEVLVSDVNNGVYPNFENTNCNYDTTTGRPTLTNGSAGLGSSKNCLFLGKAIQLIPDSSDYHVYTVLGNRTQTVSGITTTVNNYESSMPEPAYFSAAQPNLTEDFKMDGGATVVSSKAYPVSGGSPFDANIVGFYTYIDGGGGAGNEALLVKGYAYTGAQPKGSRVKDCIHEDPSCNRDIIKKWEICVRSSIGGRTAMISFSSTVAGVTSFLEYKDCT